MKHLKVLLTGSLALLSLFSFSQSSKRIKKNLNIFISGAFDPAATINFDRKNPEKHGWEYADKKFQLAFSSKGFKVGNTGADHHYVFVMDYDYGYRIAAYKMQYSNLRGEILDADNHPIGSFTYNGRYENDELADAIADQLKAILKDQEAHPKLAQHSPAKSKEDRLTELMSLFDKGLITKEDYENQKTKILNEQL